MPITRFEYLPYYSEEVDLPQGTTFVKHFSVQDGASEHRDVMFMSSPEVWSSSTTKPLRSRTWRHLQSPIKDPFRFFYAQAECMDPMFRQVMEAALEAWHVCETALQVGYLSTLQIGLTKKFGA